MRNKEPRRSPPRKRAPKAAAAAPAAKKRKPAAELFESRPAPVLSAKEMREMRAQAHSLVPLVQVGHGGVTASVIDAVGRALLDHELIKVRLHEPEDKRGMAAEIANGVRAALCGLVGHTVILYRPHPKPAKREPASASAPRNAWSRARSN